VLQSGRTLNVRLIYRLKQNAPGDGR